MTINATVVGVRIWSRQTGPQRVIEIEWSDQTEPTEFRVHHTMHVVDQEKRFELGDKVRVDIIIDPQQILH